MAQRPIPPQRQVRPWIRFAAQLVPLVGLVVGLVLLAGPGWALTVGSGGAWVVAILADLSRPVPEHAPVRRGVRSPLDAG